MKPKLRILHLEANPADAELVEQELNKGEIDFEKLVVANQLDFENALKKFVPDIIIADHAIQYFDSKDALQIIKQIGLTIPFIVVSAPVSDEYAVEVMKTGADDYILKDRLFRLPQAIFNAIEKTKAESNLLSIFENISEGFVLLDNNGIVQLFNKKAAQTIFLNTNQEIEVGIDIYDFIDPSRKEFYHDLLSKIYEGESMQYDHSFERKNGEIKWFSFSLNPVYNKSGNIEGISITSSDITERKNTENNLSKTSQDLQKTVSELNIILDSSLDVICSMNSKGEFLNVSSASFQAWGYSPEELIGTSYKNLVFEEDIAIATNIRENIQSGTPIQLFENRYVHKNGSIISLLWSANWDAESQILFCIAKNVTEKRRLQNAIQSERDQFYQILLNAPSAFGVLKGPFHTFEIVNSLFLKLIGKEDVIGKSVEVVLPEMTGQGIIALLDNVYHTGETYISEELLVKFNLSGNAELTDFYLDFICQANRNEKGEIVGIFYFINNITEQVVLRKSIEKSEKFFKGVIENSDDMITILNLNGKTIYASPSVTKNLGYSYEEFLSLNIVDIVHREDSLIMKSVVMKILSNPSLPVRFSLLRNRKKDGSYIWVEGTLTNFLETEGINSIVLNFRDITERKTADEENSFKANLLNTIGQAAVATDKNGVVNYWNKAAEDIYGWTKEEAIGKNIIDLTPSEATLEQATEIMQELLKGNTWSGEFISQRKDGSSFPALVMDSPIYNERNELSGIIGISSDNTEKKKLLALLEKSNRLAQIGTWEIDVIKESVYWSNIMKEILEVNLDFTPNLSNGVNYFCEGRSRMIITQCLKQCMEDGIPWDEELQMNTSKGNLKWVRSVGQGEFAHGKCIKVFGSLQDITERKNAADKVIRNEAKLNAAQHIAQVGSWELTLLNQEHSWSEEFYRILGINKVIKPTAEAFLSFVHPDDREFAASRMAEAFSNYKNSSFHFRFIKENGEMGYALSEWKFEFDNHQNPTFIIGILRDLTKEKLAESVRQKMIADLVQRNGDLEQFSYIVSHNLRAPAANIIGFAEILKDEIITPEEKVEVLHGLSASVSALDTTIKDINTILQIHRDVHDKKEIISFTKLVNDIKASIHNLVDKHNVLIITDFSEVDEIYSLKVYIYSIFYNLISNSIKYSKPNVQPRIEIESKKENENIIITFKDNGLGINLKTKGDKVFGLYNRFHSHVEGKGMGLFMVKTQVESLGGKISIKSEINEGAEFIIKL